MLGQDVSYSSDALPCRQNGPINFDVFRATDFGFCLPPMWLGRGGYRVCSFRKRKESVALLGDPVPIAVLTRPLNPSGRGQPSIIGIGVTAKSTTDGATPFPWNTIRLESSIRAAN